jgi:hypothetical protein
MYLQQFKQLIDKNDIEEVISVCDFLRHHKIHVLGEIVKNHLEEMGQITVLVTYYYYHPTTLQTMFDEYNYPPITFKHPHLKFKNKYLLEITSLGGLGDGVFPKDYDEKNIPDVWQVGYDDSYQYPDVLEIEFRLKNFYIDPLPADIYTSERMTHQELAEKYYIRIMQHNDIQKHKIDEFNNKHCTYYHGDKN